MKNGINVVSLFNGMNTGRQALEDIGIKVNKYYSSELKKFANELTQYHYQDTIQLGDVNNWKKWNIDWSKIDLLLSGSPCKDLSIAGKREGIYGKNSGLFWVFIDILNHIKKVNPNIIFLQENVGSAPKKDIGIMSRAMGLYPCRLNSSLVTAQLRDRYYWTNARTKKTMFDIVTDIPAPKDRKIMFKDIIENGQVNRLKTTSLLESEAKTFGYKNHEKFTKMIIKRNKEGRQLPNFVFKDKANCLMESESRVVKNQVSLKKRDVEGFRNAVYQLNPSKESGGKQPYMQNRVYDPKGKIPCLTESFASRMNIKDGSLVYIENNEVRVKTNTKKGYDVLTENDSLNLSFPKSKTRRARVTKGKSPCLLAGNEPIYSLKDYTIRPLTKIELCRLQGFPDDYCDILSRNKAASLLGDGWTLPMIIHIFQYLPFKKRFK